MSEQELLYRTIGDKIEGAVSSQMFGKPCYKIHGKAFISFFNDMLVCKLQGEHHTLAMALSGAAAFDPSGKGRPMKEWVQLPYAHKDKWHHFAVCAYDYVNRLFG